MFKYFHQHCHMILVKNSHLNYTNSVTQVSKKGC